MTTDNYWTYRPSKRPSVKQVSEWHKVYTRTMRDHWRGESHNGIVTVYNGYPFPDFYKVEFRPFVGNKISKLFYGESAWNETEMYVYDLGFRDVLGRI